MKRRWDKCDKIRFVAHIVHLQAWHQKGQLEKKERENNQVPQQGLVFNNITMYKWSSTNIRQKKKQTKHTVWLTRSNNEVVKSREESIFSSEVRR